MDSSRPPRPHPVTVAHDPPASIHRSCQPRRYLRTMKLRLLRGAAHSGFADMRNAMAGVSDARAELAKAIEDFDRQAAGWRRESPST